MTMPPLPAQGSRDWYDWASAAHAAAEAVTTGRLTDDELRAASVAAVVASGAVATTEALDAAVLGDYDPATLARPAEVAARNLTALALQAKGGSIGTGGKLPLAFRLDHHFGPLRDVIWPLFLERGLPASVGIVSRYPTGDEFSAGVPWDDILTIIRQGAEPWCHSATHSNPTTLARVAEEVVTSDAELLAHGIKTAGWHVPGVGAPTYPDWLLNSAASFYGPVGRLVMEHYPFSEGEYPGSVMRTLPHRQFHGLNHLTVDAMTPAAVQNTMKQAAAYQCGLELMAHPGYIGQAGQMSVAEFTGLLDYIVARRDAGEIEVMTATGLIAADPSHSRRASIFGNGSYDPDYSQLWTGWSNPSGVQLKTDGGHTGPNYVRFTAASTTPLTQASSQPYNAGMQGGAFRVEQWMRAPSAAARGRIRLVDATNPARYDITRPFDVATIGSWQVRWFNTVLHPDTATLRVEQSRDPAVAADIDFDDFRMIPI